MIICWYSDESVDSTNQGGTAVKILPFLTTGKPVVKGGFLMHSIPDLVREKEDTCRRSRK